MEETIDKLIEKATTAMEKCHAHTEENFMKFSANMAHPDMLRGILVDHHGYPSPLESMASISREANNNTTLMIKPWEKGAIPAIESALTKQDKYGFNVRNNGHMIYASFPPLTEERRAAMAKQVGTEAEKGKVSIRRIRRDIREEMKVVKEEDEVKRGDTILQKITDTWITKVKTMEEQKKKELMKV
ncbi:MAG: ribosome-recycling factor [Cytophagales bacterium]